MWNMVSSSNVTLDRPQDLFTTNYKLDQSKVIASGASTKLLEDQQDSPGVLVSINPPGFMASLAGSYVSLLIDCSSMDDQPTFEESGWVLDVDLAPWLDVIGGRVLMTETVGSLSRSVKQLFYGKVRKALAPCKLRFRADIQDAYVRSEYHFGTTISFLLGAMKTSLVPGL